VASLCGVHLKLEPAGVIRNRREPRVDDRLPIEHKTLLPVLQCGFHDPRIAARPIVAPCTGVVSNRHHHFKNVSPTQRRACAKKQEAFRPASSVSGFCKKFGRRKQPCASIGGLIRESCSRRSKAASIGGLFHVRARDRARASLSATDRINLKHSAGQARTFP
jgi:hypothetical protein